MAAHLYRHFDRGGNLLYVGISLSALQRLSQHKASRWFNDISRVEIETFADRKQALAAEREAVAREKPKHNILLRTFEAPPPLIKRWFPKQMPAKARPAWIDPNFKPAWAREEDEPGRPA